MVPLPPWAKEPAARRRRNPPAKLYFSQILPQRQPELHPRPEPLHGVEAADVLQILFFRLHQGGIQNGEVQLVGVVLGLVFNLGMDIMVVEPFHQV